ncbi:MAG: MmcB family DNA repair protein [Kordiimonadaceae bacterium]|nr:MmcB family DNA repair protein [Kordiimonadaceae bacterium]MBO6568050.1 MmcB family DNA repair protein [Kordiimonadaceae bacterium]MBO6964220.1 MmcB family DNA repair protein [Kordiimonadaceae bacterium]
MTSTEKVTRGAMRLLQSMGYSSICELPLTNGRRADLVGVNKSGEVTIVEVKSCLADFRSDQKWQQYLPYSDAFYFAVDEQFPLTVLDEDASLPNVTGIIIADAFDGEVIRPAKRQKVHPSRRKTLHLKMARVAASRLSAPIVRSTS